MSTTCTACSNDTVSRKPEKKKKIETVMHEYGAGELKSSSGQPVTTKSQAVAIALSEARRKKKA